MLFMTSVGTKSHIIICIYKEKTSCIFYKKNPETTETAPEDEFYDFLTLRY